MGFAAGITATRAKRTGEAYPLLPPIISNYSKKRCCSKDTAQSTVVAVKNGTATSRPNKEYHCRNKNL